MIIDSLILQYFIIITTENLMYMYVYYKGTDVPRTSKNKAVLQKTITTFVQFVIARFESKA